MLDAALDYARRGIPVFPLRPGGKTPLIPRTEGGRGHLDATTHEKTIRGWWKRRPDANIGVPTGPTSGIISVDLDVYKPQAWSRGEAERELGGLPATRTVGTGQGGLQMHYAHPEGDPIKGVAEDIMGPGVCVKSAGGYVVVPPSVTSAPYEVLDERPPAPAPASLVEALRRNQAPSRERRERGETLEVTADLDGPPITYGSRNDTLTRIAGGLHDGSRSFDRLLVDLLAINEARCRPPWGSSRKTGPTRWLVSSALYRPGHLASKPRPR